MTVKSKPIMYYDRLMQPKVETCLSTTFDWLVPYVKKQPDLDFQSGAKYISVYRGTGRIATIKSVRNQIVVEADQYYRNKFCSSAFYKGNCSLQTFEDLVQMVRTDPVLCSYYANTQSVPPIYNEGFYQNSISRRYSFFSDPSDDFIIFDKEFSFGYLNTGTKKNINHPISKEITDIFGNAKINNEHLRFPSEYKASYKECDFIALNKQGDIILLELKSDNAGSQKIYLAPLQVAMYNKLTEYYISKFRAEFEKTIFDMILQKQRLGMIDNSWKMPSHISGRILNKVIVGTNPVNITDLNNSKNVRVKAQAVMKELNNANISVDWYTSDQNGELVQISYPW